MKEKGIRQSNYELMRIVSMFFIVFWHILLHTGTVIYSTGFLKYGSLFLYLLLSVHTNTFMLVTGYFQYNRKTKYKKVFSLIGTTWFYNVLFTLIGIYLLHYEYTNLSFAQSTSMLNINGYWYITGYVLLMFFTPILNRFIEYSTQKEHRNILIVFFLLFSIIPYITRNGAINNDGRSLIHFIFLYLIGAYFGKYPINESYHFKKNSVSKNRLIYLSIFFGCIMMNYLIIQFGSLLGGIQGSMVQDLFETIQFSRDNFASPFTLIASICFFFYFGTLNIKSKWINRISSLTLGVYLVHENKVSAKFIYENFIPRVTFSDPIGILVRFFGYAIILFIISALIEWIRQCLAKLLSKLKITKKISEKWDNYVKNF